MWNLNTGLAYCLPELNKTNSPVSTDHTFRPTHFKKKKKKNLKRDNQWRSHIQYIQNITCCNLFRKLSYCLSINLSISACFTLLELRGSIIFCRCHLASLKQISHRRRQDLWCIPPFVFLLITNERYNPYNNFSQYQPNYRTYFPTELWRCLCRTQNCFDHQWTGRYELISWWFESQFFLKREWCCTKHYINIKTYMYLLQFSRSYNLHAL